MPFLWEGVPVLIDIILTTYNRKGFLKKTLDSLFEKTTVIPYRLFIIDDCSTDGTPEYLMGLKDEHIVHMTLSKRRNGIRYGFDMLWAEVEAYNSFYGEFPYLCYHQDDVEILDPLWAQILTEAYQDLKGTHNIGFFSGCDSPEHPVREKIKWKGYPVMLKSSQAFQNAIAEKSFWKSIGLVPRFNPDGQKTGFPDNGKGSNMDVWFTGCFSQSRFNKGSASPNCSLLQKKDVMVIPLMRHLGQSENSTWRKL